MYIEKRVVEERAVEEERRGVERRGGLCLSIGIGEAYYLVAYFQGSGALTNQMEGTNTLLACASKGGWRQ
jgi:hypothetical protein